MVFEFFKNIDFQGLQRSLKVVIFSLFHNYLLKFAEILKDFFFILLEYIPKFLELSENILIVVIFSQLSTQIC